MSSNSYRIATFAFMILFIAAIAWGFMETGSKNLYKANLDKEKLKNESLLSEKLSVEKERDKSAKAANASGQKVTELAAEIESINRKLQDNSAALQKARNENSSSRKKYDALLASRTALESQLASLTGERDNFKRQGEEANNELTKLKAQNQNLQEELQLAKLSRFDNPRIEASRGSNNKLVVKASRVQRLKATLSISATAEELKFSVIDPKGAALTEKDGTVTSQVIGSTNDSKKVEVTFSPKKKLQGGIYQIEVVSGASHIASLQVSLR